MAITSVSSSRAKYSNASESSTSDLLPRPITLLRPKGSADSIHQKAAAANKPVWAMKATLPFLNFGRGTKDVVKLLEVLRMPVVFGPTILIPAFFAVSTISRSNLTPSPPASRKPEDNITTPLTPFFAQSRMT